MGDMLGEQLLEARKEALGELDPSATKLLGSRQLGEGQGRQHLQRERLEGEEYQWDGVLKELGERWAREESLCSMWQPPHTSKGTKEIR